MKSHPPSPETREEHAAASKLLRRLLRRFTEPKGGGGPKLPPAGRRTGDGSASAEAYLEKDRASRPAPLE